MSIRLLVVSVMGLAALGTVSRSATAQQFARARVSVTVVQPAVAQADLDRVMISAAADTLPTDLWVAHTVRVTVIEAVRTQPDLVTAVPNAERRTSRSIRIEFIST